MSPIESRAGKSFSETLLRQTIDSDEQLNRTQFGLMRELLTHQIAPTLLSNRYKNFQVHPKRDIQSLIVKGDLYSIENLSFNTKDSPTPHIILLDGSAHRTILTPKYIGVVAWSQPDREGERHPFSHELENLPVGDYLHFDRVQESNGSVWQPLAGPEGINIHSSLINNVAYWEITPEMLDTPSPLSSQPKPPIAGSLAAFRDSLLKTYAV